MPGIPRTNKLVAPAPAADTKKLAQQYLARGWQPIRIALREKNPNSQSWEATRMTPATIETEFAQPSNVGVILGEPSGWLVDVDLDCQEAVDVAAAILPATLTFGRASRRKSHWLYRCADSEYMKFLEPVVAADGKKSNATIVELRTGPGKQTVFPGSLHRDTGEAIDFDAPGEANSPITEITFDDLADAVKCVAAAARYMRSGLDMEHSIALAHHHRDFSILDSGKIKSPSVKREAAPNVGEKAAIARYNAEHPLDLPPSGSGTCPICGHNDCWGKLKHDTTGKWSCFSAGHDAGGTQGNDMWWGDALDIAAHQKGVHPFSLLRAEGYMDDVDTRPDGTPYPNMANVVRTLSGKDIYLDTFLQRVIGPNGQEWGEADTRAYAVELQDVKGFARVGLETVHHAVQAYASSRPRNCAQEMLSNLRWDGERRLAHVLIRAFGAEDSPYTRAVGQNLWRSIVARIQRPGAKVDNMVVLEGEQGIRKSTALRAIVGDRFFSEASESPTNKDFFQALQGKLLVEVAEMDSFSRADATAVKRVLSCQVDRYRASYGRTSEDYPRQGIFVGTTNRDDWAKDTTGGRRFWPIRCTTVDILYIEANREQLLAEAMDDVKNSSSWWDVPEEAAEEQEARRAEDPWEQAIADYLDTMGGEPVKVTAILTRALGIEAGKQTTIATMRVADILKRRFDYVRAPGRLGAVKRMWVKLPPF